MCLIFVLKQNVVTIKLERQGEATTSLGFSIVQRSHDGATGIFVKKLQDGGVAETDGHLCAGDKILKVRTGIIKVFGALRF